MAASLFQSTLNGSNSNIPDSGSPGRSFTSFSGQSGSTPFFHHSGAIQGLHNVHGSFNVANIPGSLTSRNSSLTGLPSSGVQQPSGNLAAGRFAPSNLPVALSQISHGGLHGHSGITSRGNISVMGNPAFSSSMNGVGGSVTGVPPSTASLGSRTAVPGLGVSPILGNAGPRLTSSVGNIVGANNIAWSISSGGGLSVPGLASRVNLTANSGTGSLNVQGANRLLGGVLQQAPQMISMLGSSYSTSGPLAQNSSQTGNKPLSSLGMSNDINSNDGSPFDINDFPQLTGRPSSAGGPQGQLGSLRKQGVGVSSIVQPSQEFSIQNEDFPALPGFKGSTADFAMDLHQKEAHHDNPMSVMQSQHFPMGRSAGFNLTGAYTTHRQQQPQQQAPPSVTNSGVSYAAASSPDLLHLHGSDLFSSSRGMTASYHSQVQTSGAPNVGLRPVSASNFAYEQLLQQYPHPNQSQFRLQQVMPLQQSYRAQSLKSLHSIQAVPDRFGLLGLLNVIKMSDPDLTSLALGIDLTTLGLNLNSRDNLYKTFASPWSDGPVKGDPEYSLPECYVQTAMPLQPGYFSNFRQDTLFYIFYSMPNDEAQLYAANELMNQGWIYHRDLRLWLRKREEPLVRTQTYERGGYLAFDPNKWEIIQKENFILQYEMIEKRPVIPQR